MKQRMNWIWSLVFKTLLRKTSLWKCLTYEDLCKFEISNFRTDVNILKKAKKEVRYHRDEKKDKYLCKRCIENDEEVYRHCFKCCGEGHIARKFLSNQRNRRVLRKWGNLHSVVLVNLNIAFIAKIEM